MPHLRLFKHWRYLLLLTLIVFLAGVSQGAQPVSFPADARNIFVSSAHQQVGVTILYDPAYVKLSYPGGDVPLERGVCTDVVIRALRKVGLDLQKAVHEDMKAHFGSYPRNWGLKKADSNIDHRRVPNLMAYFKRQGWETSITKNGSDYLPGDIVAWKLIDGRPHIGIVSELPVPDGTRLLCIHNIGSGAQVEDVLFEFTVIGHYRLFKTSGIGK